MISFLIRKMWKNKWMMLSLLIGNILLVGIVSATPIYTLATMQRIMQQDLRNNQQDTGAYPAVVHLRYNLNEMNRENRIWVFHSTRDSTLVNIANQLDIPVMKTIQSSIFVGWPVHPYPLRIEGRPPTNLALATADGFLEHINIIHGRAPADEWVNDNMLEVVVTEATLARHNLLLGEVLAVQGMEEHDPRGQIYLQIVGIYEPAIGSSSYWSTVQIDHTRQLLISDHLANTWFLDNYIGQYQMTVAWHLVFDQSQIQSHLVEHYLATLDSLQAEFAGFSRIFQFDENFSHIIPYHITRTAGLSTTLLVLQVPLFIMLAFYIYMVSRQILSLEQTDISVFKSRGVSRMQIFSLYTMQGIFVAAISLPVGIGLGVGICRFIGASRGFMELVQRAPLQIIITRTVFAYAFVAIAISFLTMIFPVIKFSRVGIVDHKTRRRYAAKPLWQRFFLDFLCLAVAVYVLYSFNAQQDIMQMVAPDERAIDPVLFISSSLFIAGFGLLGLRIFPYVVRLIYFIGRRFWSVSAFASLIKIVRTSGEEQFVMIFLIFTMAVGIFSTQAARTINLNNDHLIRYMDGTDFVFQEYWRSNLPPPPEEGFPSYPLPNPVVFEEPDFTRFLNFEEVDTITRVQRHDAVLTIPGMSDVSTQLMGVETNTFGLTAWLRYDLLPVHANYFLNALANRSDGVLLSKSFMTDYHVALGRRISIANEYGDTAWLTVVGFLERWPTFQPLDSVTEQAQYLAVVNLGHLQTVWGARPYEVWMSTNAGSHRFFFEFSTENDLRILSYTDTISNINLSRLNPVVQGTNGILTLNFLITLLICFVGFLIYWILSIRSRVLQFGIFRAMGMRMKDIFGILIKEQILITLSAIAIGTVVGELTARMFVPLIQISFSAVDQIIPLVVVMDWRDYGTIFAVVGSMIFVCLIVLGIYISRIKVAQALKLGED